MYENLVLRVKDNKRHYPQLFTCMSFTWFYKRHTIHVGPERAGER